MTLKMTNLRDQARASIFTHQKFISLEIVVQIFVQVEGVLAKDSEPLLNRLEIHSNLFFTSGEM